MRFAECDALAVELRGARHDKQRVAILLDLRSLMGVVGILDRKIMQLELPLHAAQYGEIRFMESDPDHVVGLAAPARGFIDRDVGNAPAIDIHTGRDDSFGAGGRGGSYGCGCYVHGFRPSMIVAESCLEATLFGKASTGNSAVNAIGVPAFRRRARRGSAHASLGKMREIGRRLQGDDAADGA